MNGKQGHKVVPRSHTARALNRRSLGQQLTLPRSFRYCSEQLVAEDCFYAVLEASKGMAERVREMTGMDPDGHALVDAALLGQDPRVALNCRRTDTERNEQKGVANLMKGCFSAFRNPTAPRAEGLLAHHRSRHP